MTVLSSFYKSLLLPCLLTPWLALGGEGGAFYCPKDSKNLNIIALGDSRPRYHPDKLKMLEVIQEEKPDLFMHLGDMVMDSGKEEWQRFDREEGAFFNKNNALLPVIGNHEMRGDTLFADPLPPLYTRFPAMGESPWYHYRCGALNLLVLSSQDSFAENTPQRLWLEKKLATEEGGFLVVAIHRPPLTAMPKYPLPQWEGELQPLLARARNQRGVDLILSSHVHNYERFARQHTALVVSGGGGAPFYALERLKDDLYTGREPGLHYLRLTVSQEQLTLEMVATKENFAETGAVEPLDRLEISHPIFSARDVMNR